jgi:hypothetical protein
VHRSALARLASDHLPVVATLDLAACAARAVTHATPDHTGSLAGA